ncbi:MAG: DUF4424 family protein [Sphingorhabdus sp.]
MKRLFCSAALLMLLSATTAYANDSEASVPLGGLILKQSNAISMDSEDLYLSTEQVRVKYRFTNRGPKDVETLVAFPLPESLPEEEYYNSEYAVFVDPKQLDFKTLIDGKPVNLGIEYLAKLKGKPVNAALQKLGIPINWQAEGHADKLKNVPAAKIDQAVKQGLLSKSGDSYFANWTVTQNIVRKQVFPAGKTVQVEHSYRPMIGGSVAGIVGGDRNSDYYREYKAQYCIDDTFVRGFQNRLATQQSAGYGEIWLDYVLKSGANWKGPIKDFRLVVDKGKASNLVSFCMDGVKKIGPTTFEVRKTNFEPTKDLSILIVQFAEP